MPEQPTEPADFTPIGDAIAATHVEMMESVSSCAHALHKGDWEYLRLSAEHLRTAAGNLERTTTDAGQATPAPSAGAAPPVPVQSSTPDNSGRRPILAEGETH